VRSSRSDATGTGAAGHAGMGERGRVDMLGGGMSRPVLSRYRNSTRRAPQAGRRDVRGGSWIMVPVPWSVGAAASCWPAAAGAGARGALQARHGKACV
jgi:hypothetical protein